MSGRHDFDFLHGGCEVRHRRRTEFLDPGSDREEFASTTRCRPLFDGAANVDGIDMPHLGARGRTPRLRRGDPADHLGHGLHASWSGPGTGLRNALSVNAGSGRGRSWSGRAASRAANSSARG